MNILITKENLRCVCVCAELNWKHSRECISEPTKRTNVCECIYCIAVNGFWKFNEKEPYTHTHTTQPLDLEQRQQGKKIRDRKQEIQKPNTPERNKTKRNTMLL